MEVHLKFARPNAWAGFSKYPNCHEYLGSVWTRSGNRYTGLKEEDARRLEKLIGYPEGHLSPQSTFWITYNIPVGVDGVIMHTERPEDELKYLFAKSHKRVAPSRTKVTPSHDFVLISIETDAVEMNTHNKLRMDAFSHLKKMTMEEVVKALRLFGHSAASTTPDAAESKLFELIDGNPEKFLTVWVNNKARETQFIVEEALAKNVLRKSKHIYYYGTDVVGRSLDDTIATLDDPNNQDLRRVIMDEIDSKAHKPNAKAAA